MGEVKTLVVALVLCLTDRVVSRSPITCNYPDEYKHHPTDCNRFVHCALGIPYVKECPLDLVFSDVLKICVFKNSLFDDCTPRCCGGCNPGDCDHVGTGGSNAGGNNPGGSNLGGNNPGGSGGSGGFNPGGINPFGSTPSVNNPGGSGGSGGSTPSGSNPGSSGVSNTGDSSSGSSSPGGSSEGGSNSGGNSATSSLSSRPSSRQGQIVRVLGDLSASTDNARSTAKCPMGSIVLNCVCERRTGCNGQRISGQNCRVFNARGGPGQKAIGICFFDSADNWDVVNSLLVSSPEAICKPSFRVYACTIHNRNSHRENVAGLLDRGRNSCRTVSPCRFGRGCRTQAICRKE